MVITERLFETRGDSGWERSRRSVITTRAGEDRFSVQPQESADEGDIRTMNAAVRQLEVDAVGADHFRAEILIGELRLAKSAQDRLNEGIPAWVSGSAK